MVVAESDAAGREGLLEQLNRIRELLRVIHFRAGSIARRRLPDPRSSNA